MIRSQHHSCWGLGFTTKTQKATIFHSPGGAFCNSLRASPSGEHGSCDFESTRTRSADASEVRAVSHRHIVTATASSSSDSESGDPSLALVSAVGGEHLYPWRLAFGSWSRCHLNRPWFRCPPLPGRGIEQGEVFQGSLRVPGPSIQYYTY